MRLSVTLFEAVSNRWNVSLRNRSLRCHRLRFGQIPLCVGIVGIQSYGFLKLGHRLVHLTLLQEYKGISPDYMHQVGEMIIAEDDPGNTTGRRNEVAWTRRSQAPAEGSKPRFSAHPMPWRFEMPQDLPVSASTADAASVADQHFQDQQDTRIGFFPDLSEPTRTPVENDSASRLWK